MAKFVYRMQNILSLHLKLESEAKIELTMANNILRQEEEKLEKIYDDIISYENIIRNYENEIVDILEIKRCNDAIEIKKSEAEMQKTIIVEAEKNVEKAMAKLKKTMIERKTQEVLKEKAFEEFVHEVNEEEKKEVDQIVSYQYNNSGEGDI